MSNYPPPGVQPVYPPPGYPVQPPPSGCGCGGCLGKLFIFLGVIFFLGLLAMCGGVFYVVNQFKHGITERRADVLEIADEITPMQVPASLEPVGGARIKFLGTRLGQGAIFADKDRTNVLLVGSFSGPWAEMAKSQLVPALESGKFDKQAAGGKNDEHHEELKDVKKSQVERTIRGEKAAFEISEGVGVSSGKKKIRVQGAFQGKIGPSLLFLDADEDKITRSDVDAVIESIAKGGQEGN